MSLFLQFVDWVKREATKSDFELLGDARNIGLDTIALLLNAVDKETELSRAKTPPSPVNISPLVVSKAGNIENSDSDSETESEKTGPQESETVSSPKAQQAEIVALKDSESKLDSPKTDTNIAQECVEKEKKVCGFSGVFAILDKYGPVAEKKILFKSKGDEIVQMFKEGVQSDDARATCTVKIKSYIFGLARGEVQSVRMRLQLAESLIELQKTFQTSKVKSSDRKRHFGEFLGYIKLHFDLTRSSYFAYKSYYKFLKDFPRFNHAPVSFSVVLKNITKFRDWLGTKEAETNPAKYRTTEFWKNVPTEQHDGTTNFFVADEFDDFTLDMLTIESDSE